MLRLAVTGTGVTCAAAIRLFRSLAILALPFAWALALSGNASAVTLKEQDLAVRPFPDDALDVVRAETEEPSSALGPRESDDGVLAMVADGAVAFTYASEPVIADPATLGLFDRRAQPPGPHVAALSVDDVGVAAAADLHALRETVSIAKGEFSTHGLAVSGTVGRERADNSAMITAGGIGALALVVLVIARAARRRGFPRRGL